MDTSSADRPLLDLIRRQGPLTIKQMAEGLGVTATAVRNRLGRLTDAGLVERTAETGGRGRPRFAYRASAKTQSCLGQNYTELAVVLWDELMRSVDDRKLRRLLFGRVTERLADLYRSEVRGDDWRDRMVQLGTVLHGRGVEAEVVLVPGDADAPPVLKQHSCPYYELAETDHAICALERKMFEKVLGRALRLSHCRLDGDRSCDFEAKPIHALINPIPNP